ncbi:MAG TPA: sigma-70 family RNA polymerase sigma factor [Polyangia bacterium]|nr:sigma-70 family RNA polymerase sigma factor [Polyangia bacterium]
MSRRTAHEVKADGKVKVSGKFPTARAPMPAPANDTVPLNAEPEVIAGAVPPMDELETEDLGATPGVEMEAEETEEVAGEIHAAAEEADEDEEEDEDGEAEPTAETKKRRGDEEPASFLAMYFRDMAELEVLRPEQEFETARNIEEMELNLWRTILAFAPGVDWVLDVVEREVGKPLPEAKIHRVSAAGARRRSSIPARGKFEKTGTALALKLRALDIDRIFLDASLAEIQRVGRAVHGLPFEGTVPFSTSTKAFADYVKSVAGKALRLKAAKNEFVKANLRLVVSIARRFNHGRLPLADLIQEGNIGLMKAVERYDYRRGFRFSTYASWWIRHAISRALADKGRAVRLPVHMIDAYHRIAKSQRELQSKLERLPTTQEIAAATGIEAEKLEKMKTFLSETPVSLDRPISDEDGRRLIDVLVDPNEGPAVPEQMASTETQSEMLKFLASLKPIEADILRKRFGLVNDRERTLKEIGDEYRLSRERVRQLQEQALVKMRRAMAKRESV